MATPEKIEAVERLHEEFQRGPHMFLLDFKGLDVAAATDLRQRVRERDAEFRVVKNTLAMRAARDTALEQLSEAFVGPTAVAYTSDDVVGLAKLLRDFAKEHQVPTFKAGVVDGSPIDLAQFEELADLPSRDELVAKALYLMQYPVSGLVRTLNGVLRNFVLVLEQVRQQKETRE